MKSTFCLLEVYFDSFILKTRRKSHVYKLSALTWLKILRRANKQVFTYCTPDQSLQVCLLLARIKQLSYFNCLQKLAEMLTKYQLNVAVFIHFEVEDMQTRYELVGFLSANKFMTSCFLLYPIFVNMEVYILLTGHSL